MANDDTWRTEFGELDNAGLAARQSAANRERGSFLDETHRLMGNERGATRYTEEQEQEAINAVIEDMTPTDVELARFAPVQEHSNNLDTVNGALNRASNMLTNERELSWRERIAREEYVKAQAQAELHTPEPEFVYQVDDAAVEEYSALADSEPELPDYGQFDSIEEMQNHFLEQEYPEDDDE